MITYKIKQIQKINKLDKISKLLKQEAAKREKSLLLEEKNPDPLWVAKVYNDEYISLICALFAYGNAKQIVSFLKSLDFSLLQKEDALIVTSLEKSYYRFQNSKDIIEFFKTMKQIKSQNISLEEIFSLGYQKQKRVVDGLTSLISYMYDINSYRSKGYTFLLGQIPTKTPKSTYKRWNMYLRWMVREDNLDMGLWKSVDKKDLLMPLDTHTFEVGKKLGLIQRKSYDFQAVLEMTKALQTIDAKDPVKFDFAIYRLGQEKLV